VHHPPPIKESSKFKVQSSLRVQSLKFKVKTLSLKSVETLLKDNLKVSKMQGKFSKIGEARQPCTNAQRRFMVHGSFMFCQDLSPDIIQERLPHSKFCRSSMA